MHLRKCSHKVRDMSLCPPLTNECCVHRQLSEPTTYYYFSTAPETFVHDFPSYKVSRIEAVCF
jgi:hypothetical protein